MWPVGRLCTAGCATTLERSVAVIPGVSAANTNFSAGTLKAEYDPMGGALRQARAPEHLERITLDAPR